MAKKKARKVDRNIEKLLRTGRYWEWLNQVESAQREAQYVQERAEVWRNLMRRALRDPVSFNEFCEGVKGVKKHPESPDFAFLMTLKGFLEGTETREDLGALKGLGRAAETLRERALQWNDSSSSIDRMRKHLKVFVAQPGKVTGRYYDEVSQGLDLPGFEETAEALAMDIAMVRRLNSKSGVEKGWKAVDFEDLSEVDVSLDAGMEHYPQAFWRVLIHPFVRNIALLLERLSKTGDSAAMVQLVNAVPFLFRQAAGDEAEKIQEQMRLIHPEAMSDAGIVQMESQIASAGFEEKVTFLCRVRRRVREKLKAEHDLLDRFFDDDETDQLIKVFRRLFDSILEEIAQKAKEISPRDEKDLRHIMDQMVAEDLDLLIEAPDHSEDMAKLFSRLAAAKSLGKRLALLASIVAKVERSKTLQHTADEILDRSPPVDKEDLHWVLDESHALCFPQMRMLAPLLDRFSPDDTLYAMIPREILNQLREFVYRRTLAMNARDILGSGKNADKNTERVFNQLRQDSAVLQDYRGIGFVPAFLDCFPRGIYTEKGYLLWLNYLRDHSDHYLQSIEDELLDLVDKKDRSRGLLFVVGEMGGLIDEQIATLFGFLKQHAEDLLKADLDSLKGVVGKILLFSRELFKDAAVLIRISTVLQKRFEEGDRSVEPLKNKVMEALKAIASAGKRGGSRKGKKRR